MNLEREARRVGYKMNGNKTKVLSLIGYLIFTICVSGQNIEDVEQFASADGRAKVNATPGINSAKSAFAIKSKIYKCNYVNSNIKFRTNVPSLLGRFATTTVTWKLYAFIISTLHNVIEIFWPETITGLWTGYPWTC